jgi:hypothetical protein
MTERSVKWMASVQANFAKATGRPLEAWLDLARSEGFGRDVGAARKWLKEKHGLTMVQVNLVLTALFPEQEGSEAELLDAQYEGAKAALRPVYDALAKAARALGHDGLRAHGQSAMICLRRAPFRWIRVRLWTALQPGSTWPVRTRRAGPIA